MAKGISFSFRCNAGPKDALSFGVMTIEGPAGPATRRLLRIDIGKDGSLYLTVMSAAPTSWSVAVGPWDSRSLEKGVRHRDVRQLSSTMERKVSFHASGRVRMGPVYTYRPPLRTIPQIECLCMVQYGDPTMLPPISIAEFNMWQEKKGHLLVPTILVPGHVLVTRIYIAPPLRFDGYTQFACSDFDFLQQNVILGLHGLPSCFPVRPEGGHGYDVIVATGQWTDGQWAGPLVLIPATEQSDDPEQSRSRRR